MSLVEKLKKAEVGDIVEFGRYPFEADGEVKPVTWKVLSKKQDRALLITEYEIEAMRYNETVDYVTWETCTLRKYMNNDLLNEMFSQDEQKLILKVLNKNPGNSQTLINGGNDTEDKLFLLSIDEAYEYFNSDEERASIQTEYLRVKENRFVEGVGWYNWLRTPGLSLTDAATIYGGRFFKNCYVDKCGSNVYILYDIRPVCWIDLGIS